VASDGMMDDTVHTLMTLGASLDHAGMKEA
jgi:hypothetical protein